MSRKLRNLDPRSLAGNPRATLSAWMKYESIVVAAFRQHPSPYRYVPANISPDTVCSRIRDAIRGKLTFNYPCVIPNPTLLEWWGNIIVKHDGSQVFIGIPEYYAMPVEGVTAPSQLSSHFIFDTLTLEEAIAFTILLSGGRLLGPVLIKNPPDLSMLPDRPNVDILSRPDGGVVLT